MTIANHQTGECSLPDCFCHEAQRLERERSDGLRTCSDCDGSGAGDGLAGVCPYCGGSGQVETYEARQQRSVPVAPTFTEEWESAPRAMRNYVESNIAEYWFLRGVRAGEAGAMVTMNEDLREIRRVAAERIEQR